MIVKEIMTKNPVTISPNESVPSAVALLKSHGFRRLPVMEHGRLIGIVTDRDLKEAMPSSATSLSIWEVTYLLGKLKVHEVMSKSVVTVSEDTRVEDAAYTLLRHKFGALPVVDAKGELVGIISVTDVLRQFVAEHELAAK